MKGKVIIYSILGGLIIGLVWVIYVHFGLFENVDYSDGLMWTRGISYFLHAFVVYWAIRLSRKESNGELSFARGMFTGIIVSIILGISKGVVLTTFYMSGDPQIENIKNFAQNYADEEFPKRMAELNEYFKDDPTRAAKERADLQEKYDYAKKMINEQYSAGGGGLTSSMQEATIVGFIISAIGAAVMQRKRRRA